MIRCTPSAIDTRRAYRSFECGVAETISRGT